MRQSQLVTKTSKTVSKDDVSINARLLEQAGFVHKLMAGVYTFLPLGLRVLARIEGIIREEMAHLGADEIFMPSLQPKQNWQATGRWENLDVLFKIKSQHEHEYALGPTHEEVVTPLVQNFVHSYKDLPKAVFQIQTKFRDEARAKSGLLRGREFRMKDLYSFHQTIEDLAQYYKKVSDSYGVIFKRLGLNALLTEASGGTFSKYSHEFQVEVEAGEDTIYICQGCNLAQNKEIYDPSAMCSSCGKSEFREAKACEVGNIFELKTKYSTSFDFKVTGPEGSPQDVYMGCYGIGSSRLMGVIAEKFHDEKGLLWPAAVAPFQIHLVALANAQSEEVFAKANKLYADLTSAGFSVLFDDRADMSAGEKFADSDLIGIPTRLVISSRLLESSEVEIKSRAHSESSKISQDNLINHLKELHVPTR